MVTHTVTYLAVASATSTWTWTGHVVTVIMSGLFLIMFDLANQFLGVEEDTINKPWRPIPKGLMTVQGCKVRYGIVSVAFLLAGMHNKQTFPCVLWFLDVLGYVVQWDKNWFFKTFVFMPVAVMANIMLPASLVVGSQPAVLEWVAVYALFWTVPFMVQDLKDMEGDCKTGRTTLPLMMGEKHFRAMLFCLIGIGSPLALWQLVAPHSGASKAWLCILWNLPYVFVILYRLAFKSGPEAHRLTYKFVELMFVFGTPLCMFFVLPTIVVSEGYVQTLTPMPSMSDVW
ncbi:unnamed protein product [Symbiodinium natans]|uniref:Uncharacterized protein n=1 Tax=Symbiodinium natans TaxID=878477 RepID=A0A812J3A0_9DINO|nr:unnamed protein product [Symbiodinium natans]